MQIDLLSLFPNYFVGPFQESILKRSQEKGLVSLRHVDLRSFGLGPHRKVDDRVYGGGPGMVLMAPVVRSALESVKRPDSYVIHLSPQGKRLTQEDCQRLAGYSHLVLLAGHYEGIDERIIEQEVDEEISIGDYVLTNGALSALVLIDAVVRLLPGVLGDSASSREDSFSGGLLDCPHYTRPEVFEGRGVPKELLSGDHEKIAAWRHQEALVRTQKRRPDLYVQYIAAHSCQERGLLAARGELSCTLFSKDPSKAARFYEKVLHMTPLILSQERAVFKEGFTLAHRGEKAYPISFIYTVPSRSIFEEIAVKLMRAGRACEWHQESAHRQLSFVDDEGYLWVLIYSREDTLDGTESLDPSLRREL